MGAEGASLDDADTPSMAAQAAARLSVLGLLIVGLVSLVGYFFVFDWDKTQALERLSDFLVQRRALENTLFDEAQRNGERFHALFLDDYHGAPPLDEAEFGRYFQQDGTDGPWRTRPEFYHGLRDREGGLIAGVSGFIAAGRGAVAPDHARRLVVSMRLLGRLGPAWSGAFANSTISTPENGSLLYWPGVPWGLEAAADLRPAEGSVIASTLVEHNPQRRPVWTALYHDLTADAWTVTYQRPIDEDGRHLVTFGHDLLLNAMLNRLASDHPPGASSFLLGADGSLIAHAGSEERMAHIGTQIDLETLGDPALLRRYRLLVAAVGQRGGDGVWMVEDREDHAWLAATELSGPGWWYVISYPKEVIADRARRAANQVVIGGVVLSFLLVAMVQLVMRRRVARPLAQLARAAGAVGTGQTALVASGGLDLPIGERNEIGVLARAFREMAMRVRDHEVILEREIANRTGALEEANRRLHSLSETDGLTGLFNRRALDRDLAGHCALARGGGGAVALIMVDIDYFKAYNDAEGHLAGDDALRKVAQRLLSILRPGDTIYRYGGEEMAVLIGGAGADGAVGVARRIVDEVAALAIPHPASPFGVITLSAGLAVLRGEATLPKTLISRADEQLYAAKRGGRNVLVVAPTDPA
ncbi:GGDEF domain-containing protein [Rhodospirillum rubrum]|uniref:diguanylate cyclase n=1 Tax=Rhodospirillum rubrum (strain ATCC 11170 / ATH 1.1.1 / DSM 467 / LMG 4362 / NCIMB 8255 / S1) TaxID=269796 RepID=Q2RQY7_RHORT|nr:GGDEF domain-containing protein [Rhodospirillum rubrum]ABC23458.1 Putative diguanylate cyclase (GGDEF domain) [Rhodospirillum rubrum ATCC 11170]AEO49196.1 diguanylate cyclase [Rhodospirillum rubrum F11]MBK5955128.1 GGDEF domain-containing protein [Rhodospirillum rubrum]QXG79429.1 diguanylate cyclase [Rhodospirillum rubrum]